MSKTHTLSDFAPGANPIFPLKLEGEIWYEGWDIPGHWAVDAADRGFTDFGAHGSCSMKPLGIDRIIIALEINDCHEDAQALRQLVGRKPALPDWIRTALSQGWTPPDSFRREDYE